MSYRVGFPFWKTVARRGVPVSLRVDIRKDEEASVFIATSPDLRGLVVEAATLDELVPEMHNCIDMLMCEELREAPARTPRADLRLEFDAAFA